MNDRKRLLIMLPILGVAAWLALFGDKTPVGKSDVVMPTASGSLDTASTSHAKGDLTGVAPVPAEASGPASVRASMKLALAAPSPVNLFASPAPPPPPPSANVVNEEDLPPPPPSFVVIGSVLKDGRFNVFLDKDNQTYVATPGAVIDGNRVDVVKSDQVQLFNLSTKTTQIIPIQGDK